MRKTRKATYGDLEDPGFQAESFKQAKNEVYVKTSSHDAVIRFPIVQYEVIRRFIIRLKDSK